MILNETQTQQVANYLEQFKQLTPENKEELLDHLCCETEEQLAQGMPFEAAWQVTRERWNEDKVQKIHSSTQNSRIMLKLMAICLITAVIGLYPLQHAQPELQEERVVRSPDVQNPLTSDLTSVLTSAAYSPARLDPPSTSPLADKSKLSANFGDSQHPITKKKRFHRGIDFRASQGTPVFSAGAGEVLEAGPKGKYGNCIIIVHDEIYQTLYAHLESIDVKAGDYLTAGQVIGTVGSTGMSTGPHLHYEVIRNGERVNPADYLP